MSKLTVNFGLLKEQQEELINVNIQVNSLLLEGLESMISAILAEYEMNQKLGFEQKSSLILQFQYPESVC